MHSRTHAYCSVKANNVLFTRNQSDTRSVSEEELVAGFAKVCKDYGIKSLKDIYDFGLVASKQDYFGDVHTFIGSY